MRIACVDTEDAFSESVVNLAETLHLPLISPQEDFSQFDYLLGFTQGALQLSPCDKQKGGSLLVDFDSSAMEYRRHSSGIQQDIAKAVGCKSGFRPRVFDATAGLGGDAFILASLGCHVTMVENNPVICAMLADGIQRARELQNETASIVQDRMHLMPRQDALDYLATTTGEIDVVYLDPMFPERQKTAKVKKAMQYFHDIVGCYHEQESVLLDLACKKALKRVVVKRPKLAPLLDNKRPSYQLKGKSVRYDIYLADLPAP